MSTTMAGLHMRHRLLLVLLVCLALPLVGGCSSDPECFVVPFLPKCFDDDDDEEEKPDNTATQASLPLASLPAAPIRFRPYRTDGAITPHLPYLTER
jgi:hypothetical protein